MLWYGTGSTLLIKVTPSLTSEIISTRTIYMRTKRSTHVKEKRDLELGEKKGIQPCKTWDLPIVLVGLSVNSKLSLTQVFHYN